MPGLLVQPEFIPDAYGDPHPHPHPPHLEGPLHGDGEVVLPTGVAALTDEHLVADAARLPSLFGVELLSNHLRGDVTGLFRPEREREKRSAGKEVQGKRETGEHQRQQIEKDRIGG